MFVHFCRFKTVKQDVEKNEGQTYFGLEMTVVIFMVLRKFQKRYFLQTDSDLRSQGGGKL